MGVGPRLGSICSNVQEPPAFKTGIYICGSKIGNHWFRRLWPLVLKTGNPCSRIGPNTSEPAVPRTRFHDWEKPWFQRLMVPRLGSIGSNVWESLLLQTRNVAQTHFQLKTYQAHHSQTTFGSWDVEEVHAVVARNTFPSQNVQSTQFFGHFWRLTYRNSARRRGAKHISKSKC